MTALSRDSSANDIVAAVTGLGSPETAAHSQRFFKTGPGEYGEGDIFVGVRVPVLRGISRQLRGLPSHVIDQLLDDAIHEVRQVGLFTLALNFAAADIDAERAAITETYRQAVWRGRVNNWDLVDCSADPILGRRLVELDNPNELLAWAASADLWERRVGILGTFAFVKAGMAEPTLAVADRVLDDRRDLIQKASGWMLREVGKRVDETMLCDYLQAHAGRMGRTALSYAVERLTPQQRAYYRGLSK